MLFEASEGCMLEVEPYGALITGQRLVVPLRSLGVLKMAALASQILTSQAGEGELTSTLSLTCFRSSMWE